MGYLVACLRSREATRQHTMPTNQLWKHDRWCKVALPAALVPTSSQTNIGSDGLARTAYQMGWHRANSCIDAQFFSIYIHVYRHCPLTRMRVPNPHHLGGVRAANTHDPRAWTRRIPCCRHGARSSGSGPGPNLGPGPGPGGSMAAGAGPEV